MRRLAALMLLTVPLACTSPPGVPIGAGADPDAIDRTIVVDGDRATAARRVTAAFEALGLAPAGDSGSLFTGHFDETSSWAFCEPMIVEISEHDRSVDMDRGEVRVRVDYAAVEAGTRVTIEPTFRAFYKPRGLGRVYERRCNSFGVLEEEALAAIAEAEA